MKMNVLVVGTGNCGITYSAFLERDGHQTTLLRTSKHSTNLSFEYLKDNNNIACIIEDGIASEVKLSRLCNTIEDAFDIPYFYDVIIITVQTNYHENIILKLKEFLHEDSIVLLEPGYGSSAFFVKHGIKCIVVEAESSPIDCRVNNEAVCQVLFKNVRNPIGIYPKDKKEFAISKLEQLNFNFYYLESVFEAALHNPNLIVHTVGAIMSIPRIEYSNGDYWMYKEVFTPSVWNLVESLDIEKNNVLETLNLPTKKYVDACKFRNFTDESIDSKKAFFEYANNYSPKGPSVSDSRYITEDVSQGLVLLESLAFLLNVPTPICTSLINLASAALGIDFRKSGRSVEMLGINKEHLYLFT